MTMRVMAALLAAALGAAVPCPGQDMVAVDLDDPSLADAQPLAVTVAGRVLPVVVPVGPEAAGVAGGGFRHEWPGVRAAAEFAGDALVAAFDDDANRYRIRIDGGAEHLVDRPGARALRFEGLGGGRHVVTLEKVSESTAGAGTFAGFLVPARGGVHQPPVPRGRQIEFIGDSDTVGYGDMSETRDCAGDEVFLSTDAQQAFGPRVARHFDADVQVIARSGIGVVRNYGGVAGATMPDLNGRVLFDVPGEQAAGGWVPQVVVLTLGSNDFATDLGPGEPWAAAAALRADFEAAYSAFVARLRARYPDAFLLLVLLRDYGGDYAAATEGVVEALQRRGETRVDLIAFPKLERTGCHWHPSLRDHATMAEVVIDYIAALPELWQDR